MSSKLAASLAAALLALGCFAGPPAYEPATPSQLATLQARVAADSSDVSSVVSLAVLLLDTGRDGRARSLLESAERRFPGDPAIPLLLAISEERLGDFQAARERYARYRFEHVGRLAEHVDGRILVTRSQGLRAEIAALAQSGARRERDPDRVAVLPFGHSAGDPEAEANAVAVAQLITSDVDDAGWRTVDAQRVRMLLDELGVAQNERAPLELALRVSDAFGAGRIVLGSMTRVSLEVVVWEAAVVTVANDADARIDVITIEGGLDQVLPLRRQLSTTVRQVLADNFTRRPNSVIYTSSGPALLAFGQGLLALDAGDPSGAYAAFLRASTLDEDFRAPALLAAGLEAGTSSMPMDSLIHEAARVGELQRAVLALTASPGASLTGAASRVGHGERAIVSDVLGLDVLSGVTLLELAFGASGSGP